MTTIETYKHEIEIELDNAREKLGALKAKIRGFSDVERIQSFKDVEELEKMANEMKTKIKELNVEMDASWDQIKGDIVSSQKTIDGAFATLDRSFL